MSTPTPPFPVSNSTQPFWRSKPHELDNHRSTEKLPNACDILIIGAGYSGISAAYHLTKDSPPEQSIVLLEAREACSGATGRNGGHLRPEVYYNIPKVAERYGMEAAKEVTAFELLGLKTIQELVASEKIDCDFVVTRRCDVLYDKDHIAQVRAGHERLEKAGFFEGLNEKIGYAEGEDAEKISGVKGARATYTFSPAAHLWPYKLLTHLLSLAVRRGVNLQTHTPATSLSPIPDADGRWTITTSRGIIKASTVVVTTNAYTAALLPEFEGVIVPYKGICSHITVPEHSPHPPLTMTYAIRRDAKGLDYLIPRSDGSYIVGGGRDVYLPHREEWFNNADDSCLIASAQGYFEGYMQRTFLGWEESHARVEQVWSGVMGWTGDGLPHVGPVPGREGVWIAAGWNGHGMPNCYLAAQGLVGAMTGKVEGWEGSGVPSLYRTSKERLGREKKKMMRDVT